MASIKPLDHRLATAERYVTVGGRILDVGTDHAYLPIHLVSKGLVCEALATDINQGPIDSANFHIRKAGLSEKIHTRRTDGLHGSEDFLPDDILIFGMGGELIVKILEEAPWVKNQRFGLILQPMSKAPVLRAWLAENGFSVLGESLCEEEKIYQIIHARYTGEKCPVSEEEIFVGKLQFRLEDPLFPAFLEHEIRVKQRTVDGKRAGNQDASDDERILKMLTSRKETLL